MSPWILMMSLSRPNQVPSEGRNGTSRATGRPRFVITSSRPVSATSSINPKHFALNSVADIVHSPAARCPSVDTSNPSRTC